MRISRILGGVRLTVMALAETASSNIYLAVFECDSVQGVQGYYKIFQLVRNIHKHILYLCTDEPITSNC